MPLMEKYDEEMVTHIAGDSTDEHRNLIHLVYEINREFLVGASGCLMNKCADMIESFIAAREAALVERIVGVFDKHVAYNPHARGTDGIIHCTDELRAEIAAIREAARRTE